ncbi:Hyls1 centriolar and ciliogenesis associated [Carabus blaptoides fortunei]
MSIKLDPREVLQYLNHLGYYNITAEQLYEFIKDLKKLIKHDQKKSVLIQNQENIEPTKIPSCQSEPEKTTSGYYEFNNDTNSKQLNINTVGDCTDSFNILHSASTISSRAKEVPKKQNIISVEIIKPSTKLLSSSCASVSGTKTRASSAPSSCTNRDESVSRTNVSHERSKSKEQSQSADNIHRSNSLKPKASFIRPRRPVKISKSDPVTLYQQYQVEWSKQKLPGEDKHFDLRWAIRERMLGEPDIRPTTSMEKIYKKHNRI